MNCLINGPNRRTTCRLTCCILVLLAGVVPAAHAELPPGAYRKWQRESPEEVTIEVLSVKKCSTRLHDGVETSVVVTARVVDVERSASGLTRGKVVTIRYTHMRHDQAIAGASQIPILTRGETRSAFLVKIERGTYRPCAGGYSFDKLDDDRKLS